MLIHPGVAIIGAGVAGLAAARMLAPQVETVLFEKSRGVGGRLACRRAGDFSFDFGAQYFTVRDPLFRAEIARLQEAGIVKPWHCRFAEFRDGHIDSLQYWGSAEAHFVGAGRMTAVASAWAEGLRIVLRTKIESIRPSASGWILESDDQTEFGPFAAVILAIPAPQAASLIPPSSTLLRSAQEARMQACFALMLGFETLPDFGFDAARIDGDCLGWLAFSRSRPGNSSPPGLVVQSRNDWAERNLEAPRDWIIEDMRWELNRVLGRELAPVHVDLHRWRFAACGAAADEAPLLDPEAGLALCGDWTVDGRIEAAYLSGVRVGAAMLSLQGRARNL